MRPAPSSSRVLCLVSAVLYAAASLPVSAQTCTTTGATSCIISGLVSGVTYRITVVAHTSVGYSGASLGVTIHTGSSENAGAPPT